MNTFLQDDESIIRGGVLIRLSEVEQVLYQHPAVAQCAVLSIPDPRLGERVHAIVIPKPGHGINAANLLQYCRQRLATSYYPQTLEIREDLSPTITTARACDMSCATCSNGKKSIASMALHPILEHNIYLPLSGR